MGGVARAVALAWSGVPHGGDPGPRSPRVEQPDREPPVGVLVPEILRAAARLLPTHFHRVGRLPARRAVDVRGDPARRVSPSFFSRAPRRGGAGWSPAAAARRAHTRLPGRAERHRESPGAIPAAGASRAPGACGARVRFRSRVVRAALVDARIRGAVAVLL